MNKAPFAVAVILLLSPTSGTQEAPSVTPESGFISSEKYTNAFFGFSLPLPSDSAFEAFIVPPTADSAYHALFGLKATKNRPAALTVSARQQGSASTEDAREAASRPKSQSLRRTAIGGKDFWKGESEEKSPVGKLRQIAYVTVLNGYILEFRISSLDTKLADDLEHRVEVVSFFDPARAQEAAGPGSRVYNPLRLRSDNPHITPSSSRIGQLDKGTISDNIYKNLALGFTYEFSADWVVNEKADDGKVIEAERQFAWGNNLSAEREYEAFRRCGRVLFMATKFPHEVESKEANSLIIILAMDLACSPTMHFPKSLHETKNIGETAQQVVRSFTGTSFISAGSYPVKAFVVQNHVILDISTAFQVSSTGRDALLDVFASIDATELKGYLVAWGFRSGSQSGLEELRTTGKIAFDSQ